MTMIRRVRASSGWRRRPHLPTGPAWVTLALRSLADGVHIEEAGAADRKRGSDLCCVDTTPQSAALVLPRLVANEQGHAWDATLDVKWRVQEPAALLRAVLDELAGELDAAAVWAWLVQRVEHWLRDAASRYTAQALVDDAALPATAWKQQLNDHLEAFGVATTVSSVRYHSASFERAETQRLERERLEQQIEHERRLADMELDAERKRAQAEQARRQIEHDLQLDERGRRDQLAHVDAEAILAAVEIEQQRVHLAREKERQAIEHEAAIASLQARRRQQDRQDQRDQAEHDLVMQRIRVEQEALQRRREHLAAAEADDARRSQQMQQSLSQVNGCLEDLHAQNDRRRHQAREELVSPQFGLSPEVLEGAGLHAETQALVEAFRQLAMQRPGVVLEKAELLIRELAGHAIHVLPIGSRLDMTLRSDHAGYVTILNIGTSGRFWLLAPSVISPTPRCHAKPHVEYPVPGAPIMPFDGELREDGPGGWEHLIAIVSEAPLVGSDHYAPGTATQPITELSTSTVTGWLDLKNDSYGLRASVLSFLVE